MPDADDLDLEPELPQLPMQPITVQHPALRGDTQGEIDHRTADPAASLGRYSRTFVVGMLGIPTDHPMHLANAAEVLGDAIRRGLHPKGDVHLVDVVEHAGRRGGHSDLTYEVEAVPAVIDREPESTLTPRDVFAAAEG